jgi:hypothetical protein
LKQEIQIAAATRRQFLAEAGIGEQQQKPAGTKVVKEAVR